MYYAHPISGERYYLHMLLNYVKGATSYEHLRIVDGREHNTFKYACIAMGLLVNDNEWDQALEEAGVWASGRQLRDMFASMLMFCEVMNPRQLWDAHLESLSDDIETMTHCERANPTVTLSKDALKDRALYEIDQVLMCNGHRLEDFPTLPKSNYIPFVHGGNRLVEEELAYDRHSLTADADNAKDRFNDDQRNAYENYFECRDKQRGQTILCVWQWWNRENICLENTFVPSTRARQNRACSCLIRNCIFVASGRQNRPFKIQDSN